MRTPKLSKKPGFRHASIRASIFRRILAAGTVRLSIFIVAFAVIGTLLLLAAHAATNSNVFSASPQSGTLTAPASLVADSTAVGGQAVKFGAATSEGGGTGGTTAGCTVGATAAPCTGGNNSGTGASGWGKPVFDDEFNGTSLDTTKWSTGWFGSGITGGVGGTSEDDCYDPAQVVEANGELDLNLIAKKESCDGKTEDYATGFITSDGLFQYSYGFAEARIWVTGTKTLQDWPSFWMDGQNWPTDGELDVMEGLEGQPCGHWHGPTNNGAGYGFGGGDGCASGTWTGGWHTFAADWEAGKVTWYYDGKSVGCVESSGTDCGSESSDSTITSAPIYLIFGMGIGSDRTAPATQRMDYVRVWQK